MKRLLGILLFFSLLLSCAQAAPLDPLLTNANLWSMTPDVFMEAAKDSGFAWTSATHDSARAAEKEMTAFNLPAVECIARFDGEKLAEIKVVFYARGDAGELGEDAYNALVRKSCEALTEATKVNFVARGKDQRSAVKAEGLQWTTPTQDYLLEYSKVREVKTQGIAFRAEFVRLEITPPEKKLGLSEKLQQAPSGKFSGLDHVQHDAATGDVWIADVPMVDQGQKGYCVVAATERVMRYYGKNVDANELAQVANSSAEKGTGYAAMFEALKKLSARFQVRVREVEKPDLKSILKLIADYNRLAKKEKKTLVPEPGYDMSLEEVYGKMTPELLRDARNKSAGEVARFERSVEERINKGTPVLWTVMLGVFPEKGISGKPGGHMRLIIGYNNKTKEILFSDTWGAGHELKRMPLADAWAMTTGEMAIETF